MTPRVRMLSVLIVCAGVCAAMSAPALGVPIILDVKSKTFDQLGASSVEAGPLTDGWEYFADVGGVPTVVFSGEIVSQVYLRDDGKYLYLYQVFNGPESKLEHFAILPFYGLVQDDAGLVTGVPPAAFEEGGVAPLGMTYAPDVPGAPTVGVPYPSVVPGAELPAGEKSSVIYLISSVPPVIGEGHVIDTGIGTAVDVYVAPEPATVGILAVGLGVMLIRKRRRA